MAIVLTVQDFMTSDKRPDRESPEFESQGIIEVNEIAFGLTNVGLEELLADPVLNSWAVETAAAAGSTPKVALAALAIALGRDMAPRDKAMGVSWDHLTVCPGPRADIRSAPLLEVRSGSDRWVMSQRCSAQAWRRWIRFPGCRHCHFRPWVESSMPRKVSAVDDDELHADVVRPTADGRRPG